jgi:hypothetical protein
VSGPTYQWQTFYKQFVADGTTPLSETSENLYSIPAGSSLRRVLFKMQMRCMIIPGVAGISASEFVDCVNIVLAAGLWLDPNVGPAASSPPVLTDRNTASWLFWDTLQSRYEFIGESGTFANVVWETPREGLDIQSQRNSVAGNTNDIWIGYQFNDPESFLNQNTSSPQLTTFIGGWLSVRLLISTPT